MTGDVLDLIESVPFDSDPETAFGSGAGRVQLSGLPGRREPVRSENMPSERCRPSWIVGRPGIVRCGKRSAAIFGHSAVDDSCGRRLN